MKVISTCFRTTIFVVSLIVLLIPTVATAQNNVPCECTQRWTGGAHWNSDGTINDLPNNPAEHGIIRCGSSAETQSAVAPINSCTL